MLLTDPMMNVAKMAARLAKKAKKPKRILQKQSEGSWKNYDYNIMYLIIFFLMNRAQASFNSAKEEEDWIREGILIELQSVVSADLGFLQDLTDTSTKAVKLLRYQGKRSGRRDHKVLMKRI